MADRLQVDGGCIPTAVFAALPPCTWALSATINCVTIPEETIMVVDWGSPAEVARDGVVFARFMHVLLGIYICEFVASLGFDWDYITRRRQFKWPLIFYFAGRYCLLFALVGIAIALNVTSEINCQALYTFNQLFGNAAVGLASINFSLRTMAVWHQSPYIVVPLILVILGHWTLLMHGVLLQATWFPPTPPSAADPTGAPGGCSITMTDNRLLAISFIYSMVFDLVVLVLTAWKLAVFRSISRDAGLGTPGGVIAPVITGRSRLVELVFQDGLVYFFVAFLSNTLATVFMLLNLNAVMSIVANVPAAIASTIVASRAVRRLTNYARRPGRGVGMGLGTGGVWLGDDGHGAGGYRSPYGNSAQDGTSDEGNYGAGGKARRASKMSTGPAVYPPRTSSRAQGGHLKGGGSARKPMLSFLDTEFEDTSPADFTLALDLPTPGIDKPPSAALKDGEIELEMPMSPSTESETSASTSHSTSTAVTSPDSAIGPAPPAPVHAHMHSMSAYSASVYSSSAVHESGAGPRARVPSSPTGRAPEHAYAHGNTSYTGTSTHASTPPSMQTSAHGHAHAHTHSRSIHSFSNLSVSLGRKPSSMQVGVLPPLEVRVTREEEVHRDGDGERGAGVGGEDESETDDSSPVESEGRHKHNRDAFDA